jgi:hypothetical protein
MLRENMENIYVVVTGDHTDADDEGVEGIYEVGVDANLGSGERCEAVLDQFHDHIGISVLDDFEIVVVDSTGQQLDRLDEYENGSLSNMADYNGGIAPEDAPEAVAALYAGKTQSAKP